MVHRLLSALVFTKWALGTKFDCRHNRVPGRFVFRREQPSGWRLLGPLHVEDYLRCFVRV
ncbi:hypothetical protein THIOKS12350081 [Thiocapsa sp. KS1]|nr:hypothetical protein THIOKS12350081 [Thiocapsa sp. KS1]